MNIYKFELSMLKKSILIWGLAVPGFLLFYMAFYPAMTQESDAFNELMMSMDPKFLAAFGIVAELPMSSILGYFNLTFGMVQIPIAIQAANYGFHILSVEERELTADFLLSKPISRSKIIISKFLAVLTSLTIVNLIIWASTFAALNLFKGDQVIDFGPVVLVLLTITFFQLTFLGIGMVVSVSIKKVSSVLSFSMALGFGLYIVSSFGSVISSDYLGYLTPYSHFAPDYILINGTWNWSMAFISIAVMIGTLTASYFLYLKRNIASL